MTYTVTIPLRTQTESNTGGHWRGKAARAKVQRKCTYDYLWAYVQVAPATLLPCTVTLTRIGVRTMDDDNAQSALKHVRDSVAQWFGVDDADPVLTWQYAQRVGKVYAVEITLEKGT